MEEDQAPIDIRGYEYAYEVVARRIERRIAAGEFGSGFPDPRPLPSEPALAEWYGVGRRTIRSAIAVLAGRGLVEVRRGKGTYVISRPARDA